MHIYGLLQNKKPCNETQLSEIYFDFHTSPWDQSFVMSVTLEHEGKNFSDTLLKIYVHNEKKVCRDIEVTKNLHPATMQRNYIQLQFYHLSFLYVLWPP